MNAVAWLILAGGITAAYGGLTYDRGGIYAGLAVMAACVWADWYDRRQRERREQERVEQERRQQKRSGRG